MTAVLDDVAVEQVSPDLAGYLAALGMCPECARASLCEFTPFTGSGPPNMRYEEYWGDHPKLAYPRVADLSCKSCGACFSLPIDALDMDGAQNFNGEATDGRLDVLFTELATILLETRLRLFWNDLENTVENEDYTSCFLQSLPKLYRERVRLFHAIREAGGFPRCTISHGCVDNHRWN